MMTYIALLRGINVGGHKKVPMATLRNLLANLGFQKVQTYIQSGNVIFQSSETNSFKLEETIQNAIKSHFGFDASVLVKTPSQLQAIFDACPFSKDIKTNSYFIVLSQIPEQKLVDEVMQLSYENEEFKIINDALYYYCATGYAKTKFNMATFERKLQVIGTSRNYNTMVKLLSLCAEI